MNEKKGKNKNAPGVAGEHHNIKKVTYRIAPVLSNVNYGPESVNIVEHFWTLPISQLKCLIKEVREEGFSRLASELDTVLEEKLSWGFKL